MSDIKVKEEKIKDKTGVWYLAADLLALKSSFNSRKRFQSAFQDVG